MPGPQGVRVPRLDCLMQLCISVKKPERVCECVSFFNMLESPILEKKSKKEKKMGRERERGEPYLDI